MTPAPQTGVQRIVDIDRQRRRRIQRQEITPPLPWPLLDQVRVQLIFGEHQPDKTRGGGHRMMIEAGHA